MAGLPEGWEWDYDGKRWFYKYKPTGHIQYHFPKEGDEFPDFVDASEPAPVLAPEERLESQQQLKRQTTVGGSYKTRASLSPNSANSGRKSGMTATALPVSAVWDGDEENEETEEAVFQPENFMFLGPGTYVDVSPLNDEEDEAAKRSVVGAGQKVGSSPGNKVVSPAESSLGTPMTKKSEPSLSPRPADATVNSEAQLVVDGGVVETETPARPEENEQTVQENVIVSSDEVAEQPAEEEVIPTPFDPVGVMAEMATADTAMSHIERHPDPVEIGDNTILAPIETAAPLGIAELPEKNSPIDAQKASETKSETKSEIKSENKEAESEGLTTKEELKMNTKSDQPEAPEDKSSETEFKVRRKPTVLAEAAGSVAYRAYKPSTSQQQTDLPNKQPKDNDSSEASTKNSAAPETQKTAAAPVAAQGDHWTATAQPSDPRLAHIPSVLKPASRRSTAKASDNSSIKPPTSEGEETKSPENKAPAPATPAEQKSSVGAETRASNDMSPVGSKEEEKKPLPDPEELQEQAAIQPLGSDSVPDSAPVQPPPSQQLTTQQPPTSQIPVQGVAMGPGQMQTNPVPIHTNTGPGPQYPPVAIPVAYNQYQLPQRQALPQPAPPPWIPPGQPAPQHSMMGPPQQPMNVQMHPPGWVPSMQPGHGQPPVQQSPMQRPPMPQGPAQQPPAQMYASFASTAPSIPLSEQPISRPTPQTTKPLQSPPPQGPPRPQSVAGAMSSTQTKPLSPAAGQSSNHTPPLPGVRRSSTLDSSNISPLRPRTESQSSGLPGSSPSPMEQPLAPGTSASNSASASKSPETEQDGNQRAQSSYFPPSKEQPTSSSATPGKPTNRILTGSVTSPPPATTNSPISGPQKSANENTITKPPKDTAASSGAGTNLGRIEERDAETASVSKDSVQDSKRNSMASSIQQSPVLSRPLLPPSQGSVGPANPNSAQPGQGHMMQPPVNTAPTQLQGPLSPGQMMPPGTMLPPANMPPPGFIQQPGFSGPMQPGMQGAPRPVSVQSPIQGTPAKEKDKKWKKWFKGSKSSKTSQDTQQQMPPGNPNQAPSGWAGQWQPPQPVLSGQPMQGQPHPGIFQNQFATGTGTPMMGTGPQGMPQPLGPGFQQVPPHMVQPGTPMHPPQSPVNAPPGPIIQPSASPAPSQNNPGHHSNSPSVHSMASFQTSVQQQAANGPMFPQDPNLVPPPLFMGPKPGISSPTGPSSGNSPTNTGPAIQNGPTNVSKWAGQPVDYSGGGWGGDGR